MSEKVEIKEELFPLNEESYVAFGKLTAIIRFENSYEEKFRFHILVSKNEDGNFYSFCIELDDISYSSDLETSFERIKNKIEIAISINLEENRFQDLFANEEQNVGYREIYDNISRDFYINDKRNYNKAKGISDLLKNDKGFIFKKVTKEYLMPEISSNSSVESIALENYLVPLPALTS